MRHDETSYSCHQSITSLPSLEYRALFPDSQGPWKTICSLSHWPREYAGSRRTPCLREGAAIRIISYSRLSPCSSHSHSQYHKWIPQCLDTRGSDSWSQSPDLFSFSATLAVSSPGSGNVFSQIFFKQFSLI